MEANIKYWLLTTEFPPFFGGGISTYCRETVDILTSKGYSVTVFLPDNAASGIRHEQKGTIRIIRWNPYDYPQKEFLGYETLVSYSFAQVLAATIQSEGPPDLIESQEYNGIAYFTLLYKKLLYPAFRSLRILITVHAPSFVCLPYNHVATYRLPYFWIGEMEKFCLKAADLVISPSHYMAAEIHGKAPEVQLRYTQLFNPFKLEPVEPDTGAAAASREFLFYGKASPLKGIFELLQLFRRLWDSNISVTLRILGGTDYYYHPEGRMMEDVIKARYGAYISNGCLSLDGQIRVEELADRLKTARAVIIPSTVDNLPYAVIECMSMGKIILGSLSGGHTELLEDGRNGHLFPLGDEQRFTQKIHQILAMTKEEMDRMGRNAITTIAEKCSPDQLFSKKDQLIRELIGRKEEALPFPFLRQRPRLNEARPTTLEKGLLSVVIPYYNMGEYVEETVRSILDSTWPAIEIVIVNDGSNDPKSIARLNELQSLTPIRVIHKHNEGLSLARNTGAVAAKGEYLAFLDPDDRVTPGYYAKAIELLSHYENVCFAGCWVSYFEMGSGTWPCFTPEPPYVLYHNMINTSALVYKTRYFLKYGLNDKALLFGMEDYDSLLSMLENGCSGVALPETFFHYRVRKNSMARQFTRDKILYLYQVLAEKHKEFYRSFAPELSNLLNSNGQGFLYDNPSLDLHISANNKLIRKIMGSRGMQYIRRNKFLKRTAIKLNKLIKG